MAKLRLSFREFVPKKIIDVNVPVVVCMKGRLITSTALWNRLTLICIEI